MRKPKPDPFQYPLGTLGTRPATVTADSGYVLRRCTLLLHSDTGRHHRPRGRAVSGLRFHISCYFSAPSTDPHPHPDPPAALLLPRSLLHSLLHPRKRERSDIADDSASQKPGHKNRRRDRVGSLPSLSTHPRAYREPPPTIHPTVTLGPTVTPWPPPPPAPPPACTPPPPAP